MCCHSAIHFVLCISPALGSPVPVYPISDHVNLPAIFTKLFDTTNQLYRDQNITKDLSELKFRIYDIALGRTTPVPSIDEALTTFSTLQTNLNPLQRALTLARNNLMPTNILDILWGITNKQINSITNTNPKAPNPPIYPTNHPTDAPYSIPETNLRSAIHIPETFTYGKTNKTPILLIPGTADPAGSTYYFSYTKLFTEYAFTDPVWVNIPGDSLDDIQTNAEYVAYAINYLSSICNRTIGVLSWSQGGIDVQWALKYWPSTRAAVSDFMAVSADFHGTVMDILCDYPSPFCTPAISQQGYETMFVKALRGGGGDSAYVPTTSVYSGYDAIVQVACRGMVGGGYYSHSSVLVHPLAFALFVDALEHEGPGRLERIDLGVVCGMSLAPGLRLDEFLGTEVIGDVVGPLNTLLFRHGPNVEPPLRGYVY
ncbi:hypothetical protein N7499_012534 [Penicillium canescens]|nr:hypothetical protein N7499_012534 [Penicillium canescens]